MTALDLTRGGGRGKPLAIDLCAGLGGWASGLLAEGWQVVGIDIEEHVYGEHRYPAGLIIQDILTVDGRAFSGVDLIVASPPCQRYSWMAMPWSRAKAAAAAIRADETGAELERLNALFNACFRIQAEACAAAGRHIPLIVENVRGAIPWVGRSRWNFGSFHLWGDVPALMPATVRAQKFNPDGTDHGQGSWFAVADSKERGAKGSGSWFDISHGQRGENPARDEGRKLAGFRFDGSGRSFQSASVEHTGIKAPGMNWSDRTKGERLSFTDIAGKHALSGQKGIGPKWDVEKGCGAHGMARWTNPAEGRKGAGAGAEWFDANLCRLPSASPRRKAASAMIAKIPEPLARHIARAFHPDGFGSRPGEAA